MPDPGAKYCLVSAADSLPFPHEVGDLVQYLAPIAAPARPCFRKTLIWFTQQEPECLPWWQSDCSLPAQAQYPGASLLRFRKNLVSKSGQIYRISSFCQFAVENIRYL